jgi:alkylhydroperoxidase family enzyme
LQGNEFVAAAQAIRDGRPLAEVPVTAAERLLLEFVATLTRNAHRITDEQVDQLRRVGWSDEQIAEAVYNGALFNLFVRLADAFDIHPQPRYDAGGVPAALDPRHDSDPNIAAPEQSVG